MNAHIPVIGTLFLILLLLAMAACDQSSEGAPDKTGAVTATEIRTARPGCGNALVQVLDGRVVSVDRAAAGVAISAGEHVVREGGASPVVGVLLVMLVYRADDGTLVTTRVACDDFPVPSPVP